VIVQGQAIQISPEVGDADGQTLYWDDTVKKWKVSSILFIDESNGRIGINNSSPEYSMDITAADTFSSIRVVKTSGVTGRFDGNSFQVDTSHSLYLSGGPGGYGVYVRCDRNSTVAYFDASGIKLEQGTLIIKETTTPTALSNYGKIYTKSDNKLYFQDGAGTEHELAFA
jgi:hypothetical protein